MWLRMLVIHPRLMESTLVYCPRCGLSPHPPLSNPDFHRVCFDCDGYALPLNEAFWKRICDRIWRAWRQDRRLIARVKQEFEGWPTPSFNGPLAWLNDAWCQAQRFQGRPPARPDRWALIANYVGFLTKPCVMVEAGSSGQVHFKKVPSLAPQWCAIEALRGRTPETGSTYKTKDGRQVKLNRASLKALASFGEAFQRRANDVLEGPIQLDAREVSRALRWADNLKTPHVLRHGPSCKASRALSTRSTEKSRPQPVGCPLCKDIGCLSCKPTCCSLCNERVGPGQIFDHLWGQHGVPENHTDVLEGRKQIRQKPTGQILATRD